MSMRHRLARGRVLGVLALAAAGLLAVPVHAQDYPTRPIRMIIGVPPGGATDILGRMVAAPLSERLGRQVVIDNRPGASGIIATGLVVKSNPDGHTLSMAGSSITAIENVVTMRPHIRSGAVRGLAVTGTTRSAVIPELPTVAESGVAGFQAVGRFAIFAPVKTPAAIVERLNTEIAAIIEQPATRERLLAQGAEPGAGRPSVLRVEVNREIEQWSKVIREAGLKFE